MSTSEATSSMAHDHTSSSAQERAASDVSFSLTRKLRHPAALVWSALCDWEGHESWVPFTSVTTLEPRPDGSEAFVAYTGIGKLILEDNMHVVTRDDSAMRCTVAKTGPVLKGTASFEVRPLSDTTCEVLWIEHVSLVSAPRPLRLLAPLAALPARLGFWAALARLDRSLG